MDSIWQELIRAVPWGTVIIILRYLDIKEKTEERRERDANAKEKAEQDRHSQQLISATYATAINNTVKVMEMGFANTKASIDEFKAATLEQYKKMGITQEIEELMSERKRKP
jgi:adenylate kinase